MRAVTRRPSRVPAARGRHTVPLRPRRSRRTSTAARSRGSEDVAVTVHEPVDRDRPQRARSSTVAGGSLGGAGGDDRDRRRSCADAEAERDHARAGGGGRRRRRGPCGWTFAGHAERPDDRVLPVALHRRRRRRARDRHDALRGDRRPDAPSRAGTSPTSRRRSAMTLVVADGLTALSNGPEIEREPLADGRVRVRFADTMVMSTYLVCIVVGSLGVTEPVDARGAPVRVACRPGKEHLAAFALDVAVFSLDWFGDYYGDPVPGREARQRRDPGLRAGRDGEHRARHLPRDAAAARPRATPRRSSGSTSPRRSPTSSRTCGSATSSRCAGGTASG